MSISITRLLAVAVLSAGGLSLGACCSCKQTFWWNSRLVPINHQNASDAMPLPGEKAQSPVSTPVIGAPVIGVPAGVVPVNSTVYEAKIDITPAATSKTPKGDVTMYGPLSNDWLVIKAAGLPAHAWLEIEADVIITLSWDGSYPATAGNDPSPLGPDYVVLHLNDGRTLMSSTFSNAYDEAFAEDSRMQNYPSQVPGDVLPPMAGAANKSNLGFVFLRQSTGVNYNQDATYHVHFLVPHEGPTATFDFSAYNLQEKEDEAWGVANVKVSTRTAVQAPTEEGIGRAFEGALKPETGDPMGDFQALVNGLDATTAWIEKHVKAEPIAVGEAEKAAINSIAHPSNDTDRVDGETKVLALGPQAEVLLRDAFKATAAEDEKHRISWPLQVIGVTKIDNADLRRVMLATRVLEIIGTPKAMEVRKALTQK